MKKFLFALMIFTTLPFSSTHGIDRETAICGAGIVLAAAGTYYIYNYVAPVPNDTSTPAPKPTLSEVLSEVLAKQDPQFADFLKNHNSKLVSTTPTTDNSDNDKPKVTVITAPVIKTKNITEPTASTIASDFLNNVHDSIKKMNLERLLLENMDVLEG